MTVYQKTISLGKCILRTGKAVSGHLPKREGRSRTRREFSLNPTWNVMTIGALEKPESRHLMPERKNINHAADAKAISRAFQADFPILSLVRERTFV